MAFLHSKTYILTAFILLVGIVVIGLVGWFIWRMTQQVVARRKQIKQEKAYQQMVEVSLAEQRKMIEDQIRMTEELADLTKRIASMEEMIHEDEEKLTEQDLEYQMMGDISSASKENQAKEQQPSKWEGNKIKRKASDETENIDIEQEKSNEDEEIKQTVFQSIKEDEDESMEENAHKQSQESDPDKGDEEK